MCCTSFCYSLWFRCASFFFTKFHPNNRYSTSFNEIPPYLDGNSVEKMRNELIENVLNSTILVHIYKYLFWYLPIEPNCFNHHFYSLVFVLCFQCIANKAEELAEEYAKNYTQNQNETVNQRDNYKYYSSKYSNINDKPCTERPETKNQCSNFKVLKNAAQTYLNMTLERDKHFYHIKVNKEYTSVHVPTNVFDGGVV